MVRQDRLTIVHVASHSPASAQGVAVGDEILAIDGQPVNAGYLQDGLWRWRFDPSRNLAVLRLASGKVIGLKLGRYF